MLITSTPNLCGRSFGTNVMEAVLVTLISKPPQEIKPQDYLEMLEALTSLREWNTSRLMLVQ